jgi:hypothetical protein
MSIAENTPNSSEPVPRQLPSPVRDFVGRSGPLAALDTCIRTPDAARVMTVDGAAGVGKTTLAVYWAHQVQDAFPNGTLFANLRGYGPNTPAEPACVLASFVRALGVAEERVPADVDVLIGLYRSLLAGRRMLIMLDNAASADQVRPLLPGAPGCVTLVTSRTTLAGLIITEVANRIALDLFSADESEELLHGMIGNDRFAAEPGAAGELVRLCAGLPLAVRVAASRVALRRHTSIAELVADIAPPDARLDMLSGTDDSSAVRAVLDWSYLRLPLEPARTFRRLGLHPFPEFGVPAAAALTGLDPATVYRELDALADVHLVEPVGHKRYRIHDLLHVYAADRAMSDDTPAARDQALAATVTWYAQTAETADRLMFPAQPALPTDIGTPVHPVRLADRAQAWSWLTSECDTLLALLKYAAEHEMTVPTIALAAVMRFLAMRPRAMWSSRLAAESLGLLAAEASGDRTAEAVFRSTRADTHQMMGHWIESDIDLDRLTALAQELDAPELYCEALCGKGRNRKLQHRDAEARLYYQQALPLVRATGNRHIEAVVECNLSQISTRLGHHQDALAHARRELVIRRECGDLVGEAYALHNMAVAEQGLGNHLMAIDLGEQACALFRATTATEQFLTEVLETMAISLENNGEHARAGECRLEARTILAELGGRQTELPSDREDHPVGFQATATLAVHDRATPANDTRRRRRG